MTYDQNTKPIDTALTTVAEPLYQTAQSVTVMDNVMIGAAEITTAWNKTAAAFIETGILLLKWKKTLSGSGKWMRLFDKDIGNLPFGIDTAERLMSIAKNKVLLNSANWRNLPPSIRTLAVLSKAPPKKLEEWLADDKTITADIELKAAEKLIGKKKPAKAKAKKDNDDSDDGDDAGKDEVAPTAAADETNEQHCITYLKSLHKLLSDAAAVDWEKLFKSHEGLIRDVRSELTGKIDKHEENVTLDQAWEESQKLN
jgi:hypothetical protein